MTSCPHCGSEPPEGALFCPTCGASTVPADAPAGDAWAVERPEIPSDLFRDASVTADDATAGRDLGSVPGDSELFRPLGSAADALYRRPDPDATAVRPALASPADDRPTFVPSLPGGVERDLLPSERPYVVPPPPPRPARANLSGVKAVIILLGVLVLVAAVGGVLWFLGGSGGSQPVAASSSAKSSASASRSASSSASPSASSTLRTPSATPVDGFPPDGATLCSGSTTVGVNSTTSCDFALNVAAAIPAGASGTFVVTASSPVTQKAYEMTCVKGSYTVCTGGVNAVVYVK